MGFGWSRWLGWLKARPCWLQHSRLKFLKGQRATIEKQMEEIVTEEMSGSSYQALGDQLSKVEDNIAWINHLRLVGRARFWRVHVPSHSGEGKEKWIRQQYFKAAILTPEAQNEIREQIWERKLTFFAFLFGGSSIIQALYAVLGFHRQFGSWL